MDPSSSLRRARSGDLAIVFAVTDPDARKEGRLRFVVPTRSPGYRVARVEHTMASAVRITARVFRGLRGASRADAREEGQGLKIALANLEGGGRVAAQSVRHGPCGL